MRPPVPSKPFATPIVVFLLLALGAVAAADERRAKAVGPPDHVILSDTLSGSYFVAAPLKERYDRLLSRLESLKRELDEERVTGAQATVRLKALREELQRLRDAIERSKVLVPVAKTHTLKETTIFDLGPEGRLVITADRVKLVASDDARVHCELEKICLSTDDKPADAELAAIKLVHRHGPATDIVGKTRQQWDAEEEEFRRSPDGRSLTPEQLAERRKFVEGIRQSYALYEELQGKPIDTLTVDGLTHEQGNRQIVLEAGSKGGGSSMRGVWRRHAVLTVHVPKCKSLIVRGCLSGLDVQGVPTSLVVTSSGYHDRDYNAQFRIKGVRGNLKVVDFPLNLVEDIDGDVSIDSPRDFANSGTQHADNTRLSYWYRPLECRCANVRGGLHARFGRMSLQLEGIHGRLDVQNDFGDTNLAVAQPLAAASHRLSSVSGRVEVSANPAALGTLPVVLATRFGTIRTNTRANEYPEFHFGGGSADGPDWLGFRRVVDKGKEDRFPDIFGLLEVLKGTANPPGLVVQSRAGTVVFNLGKAP
jgi:hypothetical protein